MRTPRYVCSPWPTRYIMFGLGGCADQCPLSYSRGWTHSSSKGNCMVRNVCGSMEKNSSLGIDMLAGRPKPPTVTSESLAARNQGLCLSHSRHRIGKRQNDRLCKLLLASEAISYCFIATSLATRGCNQDPHRN